MSDPALIEVVCDLCGSADRKLICVENSLPISKCRNCSLVYVSAYPHREVGEDVKDFTDDFQIAENQKKYDKVVEANVRQLAGLCPQKGRLLDVGCGFGFFLDRARKDGWDPYGLDVSNFALKYAAETLKLPNVQKAELKQAGYEPGFFNAVTMWNVFEHVTNPSELLTDIHRLLAPGGVLAVRVPNVAFHRLVWNTKWLFKALKIRIYAYDISYIAAPPPQHLFGHAPRTMRRFLKKCGFRAHEIAPAHLSNMVGSNRLYGPIGRAANLLYRASFRKINLCPTITAWAYKQ